MKNLKKFFAFSIATAMVAGAVWAGTPGFKSLAVDTKQYWWNGYDYVDVYDDDKQYNYTEVWKLPGEGNTYIDFNFNNLSLWAPEKVIVNDTVLVQLELIGSDNIQSSDLTASFTSDNTSVAQVVSSDENPHHFNCEVKGIKAGTANISCTVTYKGTTLPTLPNLKTSITVIDDPSKVKSVEIKDAKSVLEVGNYIKLTAAVTPSTAPQDVVWESSDENVLDHIGGGEFHALKAGKATITATSKSDSTKSDSIEIEVAANVVDVSIDPKEATLYVGGYANATATLESSIIKDFESVSPDMISFKSSDESVAHVSGMSKDNGKLNIEIGAYKSGTASIAIDVTDRYSGYFKVNSDKFKVTVLTESSKQNATDPNAPTSEEQAKQEQTPESIANYQTWLATYGGGDAAAAPVGVTAVSGEVGQPGSEAIVNTGAGEPVAMFQSNDATNTLLAAPVGVVPSGTKIETVEAGKDTPAFKAVQNKLSRISRRGTVQKVYGIAGLNSDGSLLTTINGKAAMSMPLPSDVSVPAGKSLKVYLIDDNGQTTKLDTAIDQGRVVFEIPKFGTFAFVVE